MLKSKTFVKKTRSGGVMKIVREHYLRDDIWCGSEVCSECKQESTVLQRDACIESNLCPFPHYLVPDTNVVLHQIDVLEDPVIRNVIILQTVMQEVRHRSAPVYKRLKDLIHDKEKHFYTFTNEHHRETFIEREPGESANDRNDRAIRVAAKWYSQHLKTPEAEAEGLRVVLITNDQGNKAKAEESGLLVYSDIIVHRLLAVAIGADSTYPDLMDKHKQSALCNNLNYRHKMAQYAQRASVAFHTQLFFKNRGILNEEGFILFVRKNAIIVLIPKFGLEGTVFFDGKGKTGVNLRFDEEVPSLTVEQHTFHMFDKVNVTISLDDSNIQHQKIRMALLEPVIPGVSVPAPEVEPQPKKPKLDR
uniref:DIS3 homolog, exosome endoribonuclease and 3'-5' exoribonuclease n=1 Tax=Myripristis murdjan TaxID=586833 RepID=A0A667WV92_9TELE